MSNFNPREPITDPSVFSPRGMYVDNRRGNNRVPGEAEDETKAFIFNSSDMKALNRFLATGRNLQTTRAEYLRWLGIVDNPQEITTDLGKELDLLVGTYSSIKKDCVKFKDVTWNRIVNIAVDIKTYATMSGGKETTSYYVLMLDSIGKYHEEKQKENPDKGQLAELKESIQFIVNAELKKLGELQAEAAEALTELGDFEKVCETHAVAVKANETSLERQLEEEGIDYQSLKKKVEESEAEITHYQALIDGQNKIIQQASYYVWLVPIGSVVGLTQALIAKGLRDGFLKSMEKVQEVLDDNETKMRTASRLQTNLAHINGQVKGLGQQIGPAIKTLQKLQGAWKSMESDLKTIKDLTDFDTDSIPPMLITRAQLQGIVNEWNELKEYVSAYIENAYISDDAKTMTLQEYVKELKSSVNKIATMQEEQVKG